MRKVLLVLLLTLLYCPVLLAQGESYSGFTESIFPSSQPGEMGKDSVALKTKYKKSRMSFTKREMSKLSDPRVRDLYWYALNDTTDRQRYLRAHYAFNKWEDNWGFELRAGFQGVALDGIDENFSLGPQLEIGFKKDVHPYWSIRGDWYYSHYNHELYTNHQSTMCSDWSKVDGSMQWLPIEYSTMGLRGAVMVNVVNFLAGRELIYTPLLAYGYFGAGFAYSFKSLGQRDGSCLVPQWFFGVQGGWNFNQRYSAILDLNMSWSGDDLEGFTTQNSAWKYGVSVGVSYKFSKVIHFQRLGYDESFMRNRIQDAVDDEDNGMHIVIEDNKSKLRETKTVVSPEMIEAAFFQIDRIELQHAYVLNLGFYAELIKAHPEQQFIVKGFADIEVGSAKRNLWLSEQRAKVVADVLVKTYGVNPDQLIVGGGDLDYDIPFLRDQGHHRFNRCTIVCPLMKDYQIIKQNQFDDKNELEGGAIDLF